MAKDRNTFAKHQREVEKKRKAAAKQERRRRKKEEPPALEEPSENGNGEGPPEVH